MGVKLLKVVCRAITNNKVILFPWVPPALHGEVTLGRRIEVKPPFGSPFLTFVDNLASHAVGIQIILPP